MARTWQGALTLDKRQRGQLRIPVLRGQNAGGPVSPAYLSPQHLTDKEPRGRSRG